MSDASLFEKFLVLGIAIAAFFLSLRLARYVQKWTEWCEEYVVRIYEPIKELFEPIKKWIAYRLEKVTQKLEEIENNPTYTKTWGSWKVIAMVGGGTIFAIIRGILLAKKYGTDDLFERILSNTTIGSFGMLAADNFAIGACLQVILIAMVTDYFVGKCSDLPIAVQVLYDILFIIGFSLVFDLISTSIFDFIPSDWWNILQIKVDSSHFGGDIKNFGEMVYFIGVIWGYLFNFLLKVLTIVSGALLFVRAAGNVVSSFCCSISSMAAVGIVYALVCFIPGNHKWVEVVMLIFMMISIVLVELLVFNFDKIAESVEEPNITTITDKLFKWDNEHKTVEHTQPYNWLTVWIAGYLGSPLFVLSVLFVLSFKNAETVLNGISLIGSLLIVYALTCTPAILMMIKKKGEDYNMILGILGLVARSLAFYPIVLCFVIKSVIVFIINVVKRFKKEEIIDVSNPVFEWMMVRKVIR